MDPVFSKAVRWVEDQIGASRLDRSGQQDTGAQRELYPSMEVARRNEARVDAVSRALLSQGLTMDDRVSVVVQKLGQGEAHRFLCEWWASFRSFVYANCYRTLEVMDREQPGSKRSFFDEITMGELCSSDPMGKLGLGRFMWLPESFEGLKMIPVRMAWLHEKVRPAEDPGALYHGLPSPENLDLWLRDLRVHIELRQSARVANTDTRLTLGHATKALVQPIERTMEALTRFGHELGMDDLRPGKTPQQMIQHIRYLLQTELKHVQSLVLKKPNRPDYSYLDAALNKVNQEMEGDEQLDRELDEKRPVYLKLTQDYETTRILRELQNHGSEILEGMRRELGGAREAIRVHHPTLVLTQTQLDWVLGKIDQSRGRWMARVPPPLHETELKVNAENLENQLAKERMGLDYRRYWKQLLTSCLKNSKEIKKQAHVFADAEQTIAVMPIDPVQIQSFGEDYRLATQSIKDVVSDRAATREMRELFGKLGESVTTVLQAVHEYHAQVQSRLVSVDLPVRWTSAESLRCRVPIEGLRHALMPELEKVLARTQVPSLVRFRDTIEPFWEFHEVVDVLVALASNYDAMVDLS